MEMNRIKINTWSGAEEFEKNQLDWATVTVEIGELPRDRFGKLAKEGDVEATVNGIAYFELTYEVDDLGERAYDFDDLDEVAQKELVLDAIEFAREEADEKFSGLCVYDVAYALSLMDYEGEDDPRLVRRFVSKYEAQQHDSSNPKTFIPGVHNLDDLRAYILEEYSYLYTEAEILEDEDRDEEGRTNIDEMLAKYGDDYKFNGLGAFHLNEIW